MIAKLKLFALWKQTFCSFKVFGFWQPWQYFGAAKNDIIAVFKSEKNIPECLSSHLVFRCPNASMKGAADLATQTAHFLHARPDFWIQIAWKIALTTATRKHLFAFKFRTFQKTLKLP